MLRISKLADYAVIILTHLASRTEGLYTAREIATSVTLAEPTVRKLLKLLVSANLVNSMRGVEGGYRLAYAAEEITIARVIAAIEGEPALMECCDVSRDCRQDATCAVKETWQLINQIVFSTLSSVSLADMLTGLRQHPLVAQMKQLNAAKKLCRVYPVQPLEQLVQE